MFTLFILAQAVIATKPVPEPDCRTMMILTGNAQPAPRDTQSKGQRDRTKREEQQRTTRPCLVLANV
jgi:hypothetical protein